MEQASAAVVIVTFEAGPIARAYLAENRWPWPVLIDADRQLYHAYGMFAGQWAKLLGPRAIWFYLKALARGGRVKKPTGDIKQLGGNVLVDPAGIVRLHVVAEGAAGRPSVDEILRVVGGQVALAELR